MRVASLLSDSDKTRYSFSSILHTLRGRTSTFMLFYIVVDCFPVVKRLIKFVITMMFILLFGVFSMRGLFGMWGRLLTFMRIVDIVTDVVVYDCDIVGIRRMERRLGVLITPSRSSTSL